jgi:uncharacterized protein (TIGR03437 family)
MKWICVAGLIGSLVAPAQTVRFRTTQGDIDVTLLPGPAPRTVANFLNYVNRGAYNNSFIHRSVRGFVIQGGGYRWDGRPVEIPQDPPVVNEFNVSNTRGTLAMAKLDTGPNTATNQWFFNLADNSSNLNNQNGGFTVFGRIATNAGLQVMDRIAALPVVNVGAPFDQLPVSGYTSGPIEERHLVRVLEIVEIRLPAIASGGIVTASAFGRFSEASPGSYLEIYGSNLGPEEGRAWSGADFRGITAPTSLEGVQVTINGTPGFVSYVSAGQVNVQLPANIPTGGPVQIVVSNRGVTSSPVQFTIRPLMPGLLAPAAFKVGDVQYVAALRPDLSLIGNGRIPGVTTSPAVPGEVIIIYGTGFGPVTPSNIAYAGQVADGQTRINAKVEFLIGGELATLEYAGLTPGQVGLYQFNVRVPATAQSGDRDLVVRVNDEEIRQKLVLAVQ